MSCEVHHVLRGWRDGAGRGDLPPRWEDTAAFTLAAALITSLPQNVDACTATIDVLFDFAGFDHSGHGRKNARVSTDLAALGARSFKRVLPTDGSRDH